MTTADAPADSAAPGWVRGFRWATLAAAILVVVGICLQVYFIASYFFGAGEDALDAHTGLGGVVHGLLALVILINAAVVTHRSMRSLGIGRPGRMPGAYH